MEKKFIINKYEDTIKLGENLGKLLTGGEVLLLDGDLSAGKTTFTKGVGIGLGVKRNINSPTFTIVKEYMGRLKLNHLDLYRLSGIGNDFDLEEYFNDESVCVVEWPFQVREVLPDEYIFISIKRIDEEVREIIISSNGDRYDRIVGDLNV